MSSKIHSILIKLKYKSLKIVLKKSSLHNPISKLKFFLTENLYNESVYNLVFLYL